MFAPSLAQVVLAAFWFLLGAAIGSFLNVCIYRLPLGLSVNEPRRSFCPSCRYQIPFYHNLPILSWLLLRGKCANCGAKISVRYLGVEFLTGLLFLAVWEKVWAWGSPVWPSGSWLLTLPLAIFVALLVVATFIDFEHFIIPDEVTIGGTVGGVFLSLAIPTLQGQESNLLGGFWSLVGAATGFATLYAVVELGKLAFGKKRLKFPQPEPFLWLRRGDEADLEIGDEKMIWSDFFYRGNEQVWLEATWLEIDGVRFETPAARFTLNSLAVGDKKWTLEKINRITGEVRSVVLPREAMGFGDVKFIACIGAFLGWKAVFFTIFAASCLGAVFGLLTLLARRRDWSAKIPFGPYLALGALIWLFAGPEILAWYWTMMQTPAAG